MIEELVYPSNKMPPHLKCQVLSFLRIMWPNGFVDENRLRNWISHEEDHSISMMLVEKGVLISHTQVVWKHLDHAGETYKAYGLSGVFTYPAFRGKGHGKRIVDKGTSYIEASDADIGIFHCDMSLKQFYASSGWIPIETAVTLEGPKDNPVIDDEMMMMRFFTEQGKKVDHHLKTFLSILESTLGKIKLPNTAPYGDAARRAPELGYAPRFFWHFRSFELFPFRRQIHPPAGTHRVLRKRAPLGDTSSIY